MCREVISSNNFRTAYRDLYRDLRNPDKTRTIRILVLSKLDVRRPIWILAIILNIRIYEILTKGILINLYVVFRANTSCPHGKNLPHLSARRHSPRVGHRLATSQAWLCIAPAFDSCARTVQTVRSLGSSHSFALVVSLPNHPRGKNRTCIGSFGGSYPIH